MSAASGPATTVRPLTVREREPATALLAAAFRDNPLNVAVMRGTTADRERRNRALMRPLLDVAQRGVVLGVHAEATLAGVLLAAPPGAFPFPAPRLGAVLRSVWGQGLGTALRWHRVFETLAARHPKEPHWYLGLLGVAPAWQGRGLGRATLAAWLPLVDASAGMAWLETDRPENVRLYQSVGFGAVDALDVFGARVWLMRRPPRVAGRRPAVSAPSDLG